MFLMPGLGQRLLQKQQRRWHRLHWSLRKSTQHIHVCFLSMHNRFSLSLIPIEALTVLVSPKFKLTTTLQDMEMNFCGPLLGSTMRRENSYLKYLIGENGKEFTNWGNPTWFSWDSKHAETQVLLSRVSFFGGKEISDADSIELQMYRRTAEALMCSLLPDSPLASPDRTAGGMIWVSQWNALQHTVGSAFLAVLYSDYMLSSQTAALYCNGKTYTYANLWNFAISEADYVLGNNAMETSNLIGYGNKYPEYVHHRGASIPANAKTGCKGFKWLDSTEPNPNVAVGALVGGPFLNESYIDSRNNSMQGVPTTYNSAVIVGLLSSLVTTSSVVRSFT